MELIGFTLETLGKIMIAYTAVIVHYRVWKEHQVDERVFSVMKKEQRKGSSALCFWCLAIFSKFRLKYE